MGPAIVNAVQYEFADFSFMTDFSPQFMGIKKLSYSRETTGTEIWGSSIERIGETSGQLKNQCSFSLYKPDAVQWEELLIASAPQFLGGLHQIPFVIVAMYGAVKSAQGISDLITDYIVVSRLKKDDDSHSEGTDALMTDYECSVQRIVKNGVQAIGALYQLAGIPVPALT
jgi:hypothetical protein